MKDKITLHKTANPEDLKNIIRILKKNPGLTREEMVKIADKEGYIIEDRRHMGTLTLAKDLELVKKTKNELTESGNSIYKTLNRNIDLFPDIIHGLLATLWNPKELDTAFSWAYREVCRILFYSETIDINSGEIAAEVINQAKEIFNSDVSFSSKSVTNGVLPWLERLSPPVITKNNKSRTFKCRIFCPPELLLLVVDSFYKNRDYGSNLLLTDGVIEEICCMCLIDSNGFDRVVDYATKQFEFLDVGIGGGWGKYLTLYRKPELSDFV